MSNSSPPAAPSEESAKPSAKEPAPSKDKTVDKKPAPPASPPRLWLRQLLGSLPLVVPIVGLNRFEARFTPLQRLSPTGRAMQSNYLLLPLLGVLVLPLVLRSARWWLDGLGPQERRGALTRAVIFQVVLLALSLGAGVATQTRRWFSPPLPLATVSSQSGRYRAFLTENCLVGCNLEVHVAEGTGPRMHQVRVLPNARAHHASLRWPGDRPEEIEVEGVEGAPAGALFPVH